jgi:hypothetical protein
MLELDKHKNLRGLGHRSVIPYVYRRCCIIVCVTLFNVELNLSSIGICPSLLQLKAKQLH